MSGEGHVLDDAVTALEGEIADSLLVRTRFDHWHARRRQCNTAIRSCVAALRILRAVRDGDEFISCERVVYGLCHD